MRPGSRFASIVSMALLLFVVTVAARLPLATAAEFKPGRYVGALVLETGHAPEMIALTADFFVESPEDFTKFPRLVGIFKQSLGGYNTPEYVTEVFEDIRYDFDQAVMTLDEPANDLALSLEVRSQGGRLILSGRAFARSSALSGTVTLELLTDEPPDGPGDGEPGAGEPGHGDHGGHATSRSAAESTPFVPLLEGQYEGLCGQRASVFQIQTVKGLHGAEGERRALFDYAIYGRLGLRDPEAKPGSPRPWQVVASFAGGIHDFHSGRLIFLGPSTTSIECTRHRGELACSYRIQGRSERCHFRKSTTAAQAPLYHSRAHHLMPSPAQARELPEASPPANAELARAVSGQFSGYLHHEALDRYQPVRLRILASSSSENPHNPNKLFVSATSVLHFGREESADFVAQRYEPRSFYLRPGFTLGAPGTDSFIVIEEWKAGFIRGAWYSHAFGRVGTLELVKGELPPLPAAAREMAGFAGEFEGEPLFDAGGAPVRRWFKLVLPFQQASGAASVVPLTGSYQALSSVTTIVPIERGGYDLYTGALGFALSFGGGETAVSGRATGPEELWMHWPPLPRNFAAAMADFGFERFRRIP